jgi:hypothetical protein
MLEVILPDQCHFFHFYDQLLLLFQFVVRSVSFYNIFLEPLIK